MKNYELMEKLKDLYVTYRGKYVRAGGATKTYFMPKKGSEYLKLTDAVLLGHVKREYSIGVYAGEKVTKFVCFDVDRDP